jgi:hypothetical protein
MAGFPQIWGQINAINFWRGIFREFEVPNINEIFMQPVMQPMINPEMGGMPLNMVPTSGQIVRGLPGGGFPGGMATGMGGLPGMNQMGAGFAGFQSQIA